jgi:hypothetical protein
MAGPTAATIVILFGIVMAIAWILVPFAVIGLKPLLRTLIAETKRTNALLEAATRARIGTSDVAPELNTIRPDR